MIVSPSLLAADFLHLEKEIKMINDSEAEWLHFDVMGGSFVPNISFGFPILNAITKVCKKKIDVHYMITHPEYYIERTASAGAYLMNVHYEACKDHLHEIIHEIHHFEMKAGVTLKPQTPVSVLEEYVNEVDLVLIMGVNPGFGGQSFMPETINRVRETKKLLLEKNSKALIEVDGGVRGDNAQALADAGCDVLVSGSYIFKAEDPKAIIAALKQINKLTN